MRTSRLLSSHAPTWLFVHIFASTTSAFYLPGVAPTTYRQGDPVPLHVNRLTPGVSLQDGQVYSLLSYDYYQDPFHFCKPEPGPESVSESLGSILFGDRIQTSPFEIHMNEPEPCKALPHCGTQQFSSMDAKFVNRRIWQNYDVNWLIDGLPAAQLFTDSETGEEIYNPGFDLGHMYNNQTPVLHNHFDIMIEYHKPSADTFRIVGVLVEPKSNKNSVLSGEGQAQCYMVNREDLVLDEDGETGMIWTYGVQWKESTTPFATRWDKYLHVFNPHIHWFWLIFSAAIVMFLSTMVFVILVRTLKRDITRYNKLDQFILEDMPGTNNGHVEMEDGVQEDSGWKLVHGDVFRTPKKPLLLSIMAGNGAQLFLMTGFTIAFAMLGFLSPSNRGSIGSIMVISYTIFGFVGGFVSSYTYKNLGGEERWKQNILLTPVALPVVVFGTFFFLNLFLWFKGSSGAVPFTTMLVIILLWFLISVPLSIAGSWVAFKRPAIEAPVRTNQIPRQIPDSATQGSGLGSWLNRPIPSILLTGILPFVAIFIEVRFIMSSLWSHKVYYMFGFLFVSYGLMIVACATVTILNIYFVLCAENYHWQWRSFATSGACSIYIFLNAIIFWASRLSLSSWTSGVLYLGYSALISLMVFILTGTIGFFASWIFVHRIYRSIKVD